VCQFVQQESDEEKQGGDHRGYPYYCATPLWRDRPKVLRERKRDQEGDDEPTIVKTDRDAGDLTDLDLSFHGVTLEIPHHTLVF
jgi:hypothetical protein